MPDASSLYPAAPQPQQGILNGNPLQTIGVLSQLQNYALKREQIPALAQIPGAVLQGQQITNAQQQQALNLATRDAALRSISQSIDPEKATSDDIFNAQANFMKANPGANPAIVNSAADLILNNDPTTQNPNIKGGISRATNMLTPPDSALVPVIDPNTGQPRNITRQQANTLAISGQGMPGFVSGPAPGVHERLAANQTEYAADQSKSAATLANVRPLQQALPLIETLSNSNFGPGSPEFAKLKGALTTAGIIDPKTSDLQVRQEVGKYLLNYAQGAQNAGRSDNALSVALGSNPNLDLTQPANLSLVKNQIARDRMDAALPLAAGSADNYKDYKSKYYQNNDMAAFKFDLMTPQERGALKKSLGSPDSPAYKRFIHSYNIAKQSGMIPAGQ
jgi:hypothetical protein